MNGIAVAGSILCDKINEINAYPSSGELTQIKSVSRAVGGCVPNVAIDIKRLDPSLCVQAIGKTGNDGDGEFVLQKLKSEGVDISLCKTTPELLTSFTHVMSVTGGQRTFFTYAGASADFGYEDIDWQNLNVKMLHLGYFLLLNKVDRGDGLRILRTATERGIQTSIDLVSENSNRYECVLPCLQYTDMLIVNETEAERLSGCKDVKRAAEKLKNSGVRKRVIIHSPEYSVCLSESGYTQLASYELGKNFIKGTTGAGDAFCAGALLAGYKGLSDGELLDWATLAAVGALSEQDAVSGMQSIQTLRKKYGGLKRKLCL